MNIEALTSAACVRFRCGVARKSVLVLVAAGVLLYAGIIVSDCALRYVRYKVEWEAEQPAAAMIRRVGGTFSAIGNHWLRTEWDSVRCHRFDYLQDRIVLANLAHTSVTDDDLTCLGALRRLQSLDLSHTHVTDAGLNNLRPERLRGLDLSYTSVTDEGLRDLGKLSELQSLVLAGCSVTPEGVSNLRAARPELTVYP